MLQTFWFLKVRSLSVNFDSLFHKWIPVRLSVPRLDACFLKSVLFLTIIGMLGACDPDPAPPVQDETSDMFTSNSSRPREVWDQEVMPDLAVDLPGPLLNSVLPTRSPLRGGIEARIIGADFRDPMYVRIGDQPCDTLVIDSSALMRCRVPAVTEPITVPVVIAWLPEGSSVDPSSTEARDQIDGGARIIEEAFTYYSSLSVEQISPQEGPASGSTEVTITGAGFSEPMDVRFGDLPALRVVVEDEQTLSVRTPAAPAGWTDVSIRSAQELVVVERGFNFQVPVGIDEITPRWGSVSGGEPLELYGYGLLTDTEVSVGGARARVEEVREPGRVSVLTPPSPRAGWAQLRVENSNGSWSNEQGYLYLDNEPGPFEVLGLTPNKLPADRGGRILIGGNGFTESTQVFVDGLLVGCEFQAPQRLSCFAPAHDAGEVRVKVIEGDEDVVFMLTYLERLELYQLIPDRAAMSGGALIRARGQGFTSQSSFKFGDLEVPIERLVSSGEAWLRVPPHPPALLDVTLSQQDALGDQQVYLPEAFTYFDPLSRYGGNWGEPITGSVNVTVLNIYDFSPIPEATVELRPFDAPQGEVLVSGLTDERGLVTVSLEDLRGPLHLNVAKAEFEVQTLERVVSENVTILLFPFVPPEGMGDPPPTPDPVQLSGTLIGLNDIPKPSEPGFVLRAFVDVSHRGMQNRAFGPPPAPMGVLSEDGPFNIFAPAGQMALIGTAAYIPTDVFERYERGELNYWLMRVESRPIKIGMIRFLSLSPGAGINNLELSLNRDLDEQADVRLLGPSSAAGSIYTDSFGEVQTVVDDHEVRVFFDLGPDGYWELDVGARSENTQQQIRGLPDLSEWPDMPELRWLAYSAVHPNGVNSFTYHTQSEFNRAVEIGPFVGAPRLISHEYGDTFRVGDTLVWELWPTADGSLIEPSQVTMVQFYQEGLPIWNFTLPGGVNELTIPPLPPTETGAGLSTGPTFITIRTLRPPLGFDYQDYNLLDLNRPESYSSTQLELVFVE